MMGIKFTMFAQEVALDLVMGESSERVQRETSTISTPNFWSLDCSIIFKNLLATAMGHYSSNTHISIHWT